MVPSGLSFAAKAMRDPSCEIAGAGARVAPICRNVAGSLEIFARSARKLSLPPAPATSSVDSNATMRPSPLIDGLMLIPSSAVLVMRRSGDCMRALCQTTTQSDAAASKTRNNRLVRTTDFSFTPVGAAEFELADPASQFPRPLRLDVNTHLFKIKRGLVC